MNVTKHIDHLAKKIWDYHHLNQKLEKADAILVLGSHDLRVAKRGAEIFKEDWAPLVIFSGGLGRLTSDLWDKPEAEMFADVALKMGVPKEKILIENKSTNTGENVILIKQLLKEKGLNFNKFIVVQKPYMERRVYATFKKIWPEADINITSPEISYEDYPNQEITKEQLINIMVGDLQRIKVYPEKGFQIKQEIPSDVWEAYEELVNLGYDQQLVK